MRDEKLAEILSRVSTGEITPDAALDLLEKTQVEDLTFAHIDHGRKARQGFQEVVFGEGKTKEQVVRICESLVAHSGSFLATRVLSEARRALIEKFPKAQINELARTVYLAPDKNIIIIF